MVENNDLFFDAIPKFFLFRKRIGVLETLLLEERSFLGNRSGAGGLFTTRVVIYVLLFWSVEVEIGELWKQMEKFERYHCRVF